MNKKNILKWIILTIAIAINIFIIVNAFIDGETSAKESGAVEEVVETVVNTVKPETITAANREHFSLITRKVFGHFLLFVGSGVFSTWAIYLFVKDTKVGYFLCQICFTLLHGFVLGILSEFIQKFTDGRVGAWKDVGIDFAGYFLGFLAVFLVFLILKSRIFKLKNYKKKSGQ